MALQRRRSSFAVALTVSESKRKTMRRRAPPTAAFLFALLTFLRCSSVGVQARSSFGLGKILPWRGGGSDDEVSSSGDGTPLSNEEQKAERKRKRDARKAAKRLARQRQQQASSSSPAVGDVHATEEESVHKTQKRDDGNESENDGDSDEDGTSLSSSKSTPATTPTESAVNDYVAAMKEKDDLDRLQDNAPTNESQNPSPPDVAVDADYVEDDAVYNQRGKSPGGTPSGSAASKNESDNMEDTSDSDPIVVGVKPHKKSNAVGDPDGDDDDDSDTSDFSDEEWEEIAEFINPLPGSYKNEPQLQVEMEVVEDSPDESAEQDPEVFDLDDVDADDAKPSGGGGGVGVRLGRGISRRRQKKNGWRKVEEQDDGEDCSYDQDRLLNAWMPFLYFPPTPSGMEYLSERSRIIDASSKTRLDRRTLYANLLLEFGKGPKASATPSATRKFVSTPTAQILQAALAMASQPQWRQSAPRNCGICLYQQEEKPGEGCTLGMQETLVMALAHSMGCGVLILDDQIINTVRQTMSQYGIPDSELKPAALLQSLLTMAREGGLVPTKNCGSISRCMQRDLTVELDDPFDERASISLNEMIDWEDEWQKDIAKTANEMREKSAPLSLLVFLRTSSSKSLLKSKSAMELLIKECTSNDSTHLITLGRGIDSSTKALPTETVSAITPTPGPQGMLSPDGTNQNLGNFMANNQNASGQNDPEGSRRFNIFLARTTEPDGTPGVIGAIASPEAGNLFPQIMAMQAREKLEQHDEDSPERANLERWAHMLEEHMENNGGVPVTPPQYFNASLALTPAGEPNKDGSLPPPPPEVVEQTLQKAMTELLDRLSMMDDGDASQSSTEFPTELSPDLHKAFAQVLKNDDLRRGIADNLIRATPALSDPKCQGVMLSVYVPPPSSHVNHGQLPQNSSDRSSGNVGGWFQKMRNNQNQDMRQGMPVDDSNESPSSKQKRVRAMAAAAAMSVAGRSQEARQKEKSNENKAERNLGKLEAICRPITIGSPPDPVRAKSWDSWIARERGAIVFKQNRIALNKELAARKLAIQQHTGTRGAGSPLRQMLSIRPLENEMEDVIKYAVELEAAKSLRQHETPDEMHTNEMNLDLDVSLTQLVLNGDEMKTSIEPEDSSGSTKQKKGKKNKLQFIHPSSLETAISAKCRISPSPVGGLSLSGSTATHRTRDDISALAQDKHERALVSQVVSPQDIGVTYDMIGGLSEVKELLRQSITYPLKYPHLYSEGIAREAVKGVLLFGPPGTGKTMLAKAVATEGGASFLSVDASSVENKWLGESEKNAKAVFTLARRLAPCVIFIDEVDSLLSSREGGSDDSAHGTLTSVKTTMMSEWDGLNSGTNGNGEAGSDRVVVIGSTNRPFDLDEAVLRRFPRRILVDLPDLSTRKEILEVTLAENRLDSGVNLTQIAERLDGYTGSDIKEVCREAVVQISHEQAKLLDQGFADSRKDLTEGSLQRLRPVTKEDFENALTKLKRSVSEKGRELARVWEWNDEYGEIKKEEPNRLPQLMNMYL